MLGVNAALAAISAICVGIDEHVTERRVSKYGIMAEVNPLIRQLMEDYGKNVGLLAHLVLNAAILAVLWQYNLHTLLAVFTGAKLGLLAMQIKSLQMETYVEKALAAARARLRAEGK